LGLVLALVLGFSVKIRVEVRVRARVKAEYLSLLGPYKPFGLGLGLKRIVGALLQRRLICRGEC
jgi:hypothetical protein